MNDDDVCHCFLWSFSLSLQLSLGVNILLETFKYWRICQVVTENCFGFITILGIASCFPYSFLVQSIPLPFNQSRLQLFLPFCGKQLVWVEHKRLCKNKASRNIWYLGKLVHCLSVDPCEKASNCWCVYDTGRIQFKVLTILPPKYKGF